MAIWKEEFFLVLCNDISCKILITHLHGKEFKRIQTISLAYTAKEVKLFAHEGEFYLIIGSSLPSLFRWSVTYFDEIEDAIGPVLGFKNMEIVSLGNMVVICITEDSYTQVYSMKNGSCRLIQTLHTMNVKDVAQYNVQTVYGKQHFLLVLLESKESQTYWWNGDRFSTWIKIRNLCSPSKAFSGEIRSEPFVFVICQDNINMYHATSIDLQLVRSLEVPGDVADFSVVDPYIVVLVQMPFRHRIIVVLEFNVRVITQEIYQDPYDKMYMRNSMKKLNELKYKIKNISNIFNRTLEPEEFFKSNKSVQMDHVLVSKKAIFNDVYIKTLVVNPKGKELHSTPKQIRENLKQIKRSTIALEKNLSHLDHVVVEGDLTVDLIQIDDVHLDILNGKYINDILSLSKNQNFSHLIKAPTIMANRLDSTIINRRSSDIIIRKTGNQTLTGNVKLANMNARKVKISDISRINGVHFDEFAKMGSPVISGKKTVDQLMSEDISVVYTINDVPAKSWLNKAIPLESEDIKLNVKSLKVENITVDYINGIIWSDVVSRIFNNTEALRVNQLNTKYINDVPVNNLFNILGYQSISSNMVFANISANNIHFEKLNGVLPKSIGNNIFDISDEDGELVIHYKPEVEVTGDFNVSNIIFKNVEPYLSSYSMGLLPRDNSDEDFGEFMDYDYAIIKGSKITIRGNVKVIERLKAARINRYDVNSVLDNAFLLDEPNSLNNITFASINVDRTICNVLNETPLASAITTLSAKGNLSVSVINLKYCSESMCQVKLRNLMVKNNVIGSVYSYNMTELYNLLLSMTRKQEISGNYFVHHINTNYLKVHDINNVYPGHLLYADNEETQEIPFPVEFYNSTFFSSLSYNDSKSCELVKLLNQNFSGIKHFDSIELSGKMVWEEPSQEINSISRIFKNSVIPSKNFVVKFPIVFGQNVSVESLRTRKHINDVDLQLIKDDAIFSSVPVQYIAGNPVVNNIYAYAVIIDKNIVSDNIDNVDIVDLDANLVRKSNNSAVRGKKYLPAGFATFSLNVSDTVHTVNTTQLVYIDDFLNDSDVMRVLPPTVFKSMHILSSINLTDINGLKFQDFKNSLVSLHANETLDLLKFEDSITIGVLNVSQVNGISIKDVVLINGHNQSIKGNVGFSENLAVTGNINVEVVNGVTFLDLYKKSIKNDENSTFYGNLTFANSLTVRENLQSKIINNCHINELYMNEKQYRPLYVISKSNEDTAAEIKYINKIAEERKRAKIFKYLDDYKNVEFALENVQYTTSISYGDNFSQANIYGMAWDDCGLPSSCLCPRQYTLNVTNSKIDLIASSNRTFYFYSAELGISLQVVTNSKSYSPRCDAHGIVEATEIQWSKITNKVRSPSRSINMEEGYLSDVKFFTLGDSVYIALAFLYKRNVAANPKVLVYELHIERDSISLIDTIATDGTVVLDVIWASPSYVLVIGNVMSEETDSSYIDVYIFREKINKFEKLKSIRTHAIVGLKAVRIMKESFIFVIQEYPWPLLAFKYDNEHSVYYYFDKLGQTAGFYSVNALPMTGNGSGSTYAGVVSVNNVFTIVNYKHVEGWVEELSVPQDNVQYLQVIICGNSEYLLSVSPTGRSPIYRIVSQAG